MTYTYDALGRLITSSTSGGPDNGTQTGTSFDPANNRTNYTVTGGLVPPSFAIGNAPAVSEGGNLTFTVTKTGTTSSSFSVNYATTTGGTATSGTDYTATSGTLTFPAGGTTSLPIPVPTLPDSLVESPETVLVTLSSPTGGATITTSQGSGTINDVSPLPSFAIGNAPAVSEGGNLTFTVTKTGTTSSSFSVNYATTTGGTATSGTDYTATSGTLTFPAGGTTSLPIPVPTLPDSLVESPETVLVTLSSPTGGATITTSQGSGTINDVSPLPSFAIGNAPAVSEGANLTFTVTKTGTTSSSFSVNYATTTGGTATSGTDYTATSGTLTFPAGGTTSQPISVPTLPDSLVESPETVLVTLSSPTGGATITTSQGSGTINDLPPPPSFAIGNATAVSEGSPLTFTVTKTGTTSSTYSVNYATTGGTATSGTDYTATSGTLVFAAGGTSSQPISVPTLTDSVVESPETVLVTLSSPTGGATITTSQGSGTINNASSNLPPVANADTTSFNCSVYQTVNLVANDTDPENNVPLHLVSITGPGSATVTSTTSVTIGENSTGTFTFSYVVADSLGATSMGQLTATVTGLASQCVSF